LTPRRPCGGESGRVAAQGSSSSELANCACAMATPAFLSTSRVARTARQFVLGHGARFQIQDGIPISQHTSCFDSSLSSGARPERESCQKSHYSELLCCAQSRTKPDGGGRDTLQERSHAQEWLLSGSRDFRDVCRFAELDPDYICDKAKALAAARWPTLDTGVSREKIAQAA
jgi:hypothetical protein